MASATPFNFDNLMPGFDFLKQFAAAGGPAGMPQAAQWVTPTLDPKELEKRIQELKSVQFWLDQNAKALSATIQALEVQRMTLETLQGMNLGAADVAAAMKGQDKTSPVDPMQWWSAISEQFQGIAAKTMQEMQEHSASFSKASQSKPAKTAAAKKSTKPAAKARAGTRTSAAKTKR
jgi:hypothetical protein